MCLCTCTAFSFFIIFLCSLINQVIFMVLNSLNCDIDTMILTVLWLQTIFSFFINVYICIPGLRSLTKLLYLHLLPSLILFLLSLYVAYALMKNPTTCIIYGNDMQSLINAVLFSQGVIPILAIIVLSNDLRKSCGKKSYKKMDAYDTDED